jgi:hypothetical protein
LTESQSIIQKKEFALGELEKQFSQLKKATSADKEQIEQLQNELNSTKRKVESLEEDARRLTVESTGLQRVSHEKELELNRMKEEVRRLEAQVMNHFDFSFPQFLFRFHVTT